MPAEQVSIANSIALGEPVPAEVMRRIERTLQLHHFKWDTHVGDSNVLSSQPFLIADTTWKWLCAKAEQAAKEMFAFEQEIALRPTLQEVIGIPRPLQKLFRGFKPQYSLRTMRFDFHPTSTGWLLSEVNSDVPGGFGEASFLPKLFASLAHSAPPAFLLDANRKNAGFSPQLGWFDNRSIVRESDLPTADFLKQNGIRQVIVIRSNRNLQTDLQAVQTSWQDAGLAIAVQAVAAPWSPQGFKVRRVSILRLWWNKIQLRFGYRLNSSGSFGRFVHGSGG